MGPLLRYPRQVKLTNLPSPWFVRLTSGADVIVWADAYSQEGPEYVFGSLVDATAEEQQYDGLQVTARTPANPQRVEIAVARIPKAVVARISSQAP
jgi:hypothetical protein